MAETREHALLTPWLIPLATATSLVSSPAELARSVGGKAAVLSQLYPLPIAVPAGLALSVAAFDAFAERHAVGALLRRYPCDTGDPASFERASQAVYEHLSNARLDDALHEAVTRALEALTDDGGGEPLPIEGRRWAVRSSALGEDSDAHSFAGQLSSFLDVESNAVGPAIVSCWCSYWSARVLFYQAARGKTLRGMGVLIQRMITPQRGGVYFTQSPSSQAPDCARIEFVAGHPEGLVSGRETPEVVEFRRDAGPADDRFSALAATGAYLETVLGAPQDIEWLVDAAERLWIVQSRPITTPAAAPALTESYQTFSNVNVNENYPRPISPLLYSIAAEAYERYFHNLGRLIGVDAEGLDAVAPALRHTVGAHGAHLYYNLTNIHRCIQAAPLGDELSSVFDAFVGVDDEGRSLPKEDAAAPRRSARTFAARRLGQLPSVLQSVALGARSLSTVPSRVARFERRVDAYVERSSALAARPGSELFPLFQAFIEIRLLKWSDASLADLSAALGYASLKQVLRMTLGQTAADELPQTVLLAIPDVVSSGPVHALWELSRRARRAPALRRALLEQPARRTYEALQQGAFPEFKPAFDDYIARFGFRVSGELMLTTRSYVEEPERLLEVLVPYLDIEGPSPEVTTAHQAKQRDAAVRDVRARLTWPARIAFDAALHATQAGIRLRERARLKQAHLYCQFRQVVGALGARLQQQGKLERADDLLYLRWREIDDWLSGHELLPGAIKPLIALRRRVYAEQERRFAGGVPPTVRLRVGDYLIHAGPVDGAPAEGGSLQGLGVAGGQARGRARVLRHAHEQGQFQSGECLVTEQTDPGWAPLFFRAAGLVMERGGMLSHGAIVAREFGIPAVVAARGATQLVHTGDYLEIDGNAGLVRKLEANERSPGAG